MFFCSSFGNFFLKHLHNRWGKVSVDVLNPPVRIFVEGLREGCNCRVWGMTVLLEPLLQSGNLHSGCMGIFYQYFGFSPYQVIIPPPRPCPPHPNFAMCKFWAKYPLICLKFWNLSSGKFCEAHVKIKYRQHRKSLQIFWMTFYNQPQLSSASKKMNYLTLSKDFSVQGICNGLSSHF